LLHVLSCVRLGTLFDLTGMPAASREAAREGQAPPLQSSASRQVEEQDFGVVHAGELDGLFGGDGGAVAFFELLAV
jgi:hypothetical protein